MEVKAVGVVVCGDAWMLWERPRCGLSGRGWRWPREPVDKRGRREAGACRLLQGTVSSWPQCATSSSAPGTIVYLPGAPRREPQPCGANCSTGCQSDGRVLCKADEPQGRAGLGWIAQQGHGQRYQRDLLDTKDGSRGMRQASASALVGEIWAGQGKADDAAQQTAICSWRSATRDDRHPAMIYLSPPHVVQHALSRAVSSRHNGEVTAQSPCSALCRSRHLGLAPASRLDHIAIARRNSVAAGPPGQHTPSSTAQH